MLPLFIVGVSALFFNKLIIGVNCPDYNERQ